MMTPISRNTTIVSHARFAVREESCADFERVATALVARAEQEPGTLTYRFFRGAPGNYAAIEEYADAEAVDAHQAANQDLLARVFEYAEQSWITVHGPVGAEIQEWARGAEGVTLFLDPL
ncbi:antibiotic biosynthesis monooxygenase [Catenulispora sp. NF23]|uniref:putative quinol monooxygenase n=1 Tax=Catenulispora pinistramenti TaxID=2705254 RepID=UPI001BA56905|nr:antibiotic biosynthesis monooxygenase [Catenulispora pinistramenti]MBS2534343.1 antibiotic biosynthesis monooxygenase [Catenulispora pinistramenti]